MRTQPMPERRAAHAYKPASPRRVGGPSIRYSFKDLRERWHFLADNEYIVSGYRASLSWSECLRSVFQVHNETINVWTHLLGAVVFVWLMISLCYGYLPTHYAGRACKDSLLMVDGHHTGHMLDTCLFPPSGTVPGSCVGRCEPVPTLQWMRRQLEANTGRGGAGGAVAGLGAGVLARAERLEEAFAQITDDLRVAQQATTQDARRRLEQLRASVRDQMESVRESLARARSQTDHQVVHVLGGAHTVLERLADVVHGAASRSEVAQSATPLPTWPIFVFLGSAFICLAMSSFFHAFHVISPSVFKQLAKLDYAGISILIAGSSVPIMYYGFCNPLMRYGYITALTSVCGACVVVSLMDKFSDPRYRVLRMSLYVGAGCMGGFPMAHMAATSDMPEIGTIMQYLLIMGSMYIVGALLYAARIPERFYPGKFDYLLSSHQIFHILVFSAAVVHYQGVLGQFALRSLQRC